MRRLAGTASARTVGAMRALVCLVLLASVLWEDVASTALIPVELRRLSGLLSWLTRSGLPIGSLLSSGTALASSRG